MSAATAPMTTTTRPTRLLTLARAELTLMTRSKGVLFSALFVPLILPVSIRASLKQADLRGTGLSLGSAVLSSAIGFSLLFAVYSSLVSVYASRREELVLKRLRTGELRDAEILTGAALPAVAIGLLQCAVLAVGCAVALEAGAPGAPLYAVVGLLLGVPLCVALAALTTVVSRSVESAQVASVPMVLVTMFGSGAFVPLQVMPHGLAVVCRLLPLTPTITLVRGGWDGTLTGGEATSAVAVAALWIALATFAVRRWFRWEPRR